MSSGQFDTYLSRLRAELTKRGLVDARIVEEAHDHLTDAAERAIESGLSPDEAERDAISRFGSPETAANTFAAEKVRRAESRAPRSGALGWIRHHVHGFPAACR